MVEQLSSRSSNPKSCRSSRSHCSDQDEWNRVLLPGDGNWDNYANIDFECQYNVANGFQWRYVSEVDPMCGYKLDWKWDMCCCYDLHLF